MSITRSTLNTKLIKKSDESEHTVTLEVGSKHASLKADGHVHSLVTLNFKVETTFIAIDGLVSHHDEDYTNWADVKRELAFRVVSMHLNAEQKPLPMKVAVSEAGVWSELGFLDQTTSRSEKNVYVAYSPEVFADYAHQYSVATPAAAPISVNGDANGGVHADVDPDHGVLLPLTSHKTHVADLKAAHDSEKAALELAHRTQVRELEEQLKNVLEDSEKSKAEKAELATIHEQAVIALEAKHQEHIVSINLRHKEQVDALAAARDKVQEQLSAAILEKGVPVDEYDNLRSQVAAHEEAVAKFADTIEDLNADLNAQLELNARLQSQIVEQASRNTVSSSAIAASAAVSSLEVVSDQSEVAALRLQLEGLKEIMSQTPIINLHLCIRRLDDFTAAYIENSNNSSSFLNRHGEEGRKRATRLLASWKGFGAEIMMDYHRAYDQAVSEGKEPKHFRALYKFSLQRLQDRAQCGASDIKCGNDTHSLNRYWAKYSSELLARLEGVSLDQPIQPLEFPPEAHPANDDIFIEQQVRSNSQHP